MKARSLIIAALVLATALAAGYALLTLFSEMPDVPQERAVSILIVRNPPALTIVEETFVERMAELGYVEGQRVTYRRIDVSTDVESTKARILAEMDQGEPDLILALGVIAARAAKEVTGSRTPAVPVLFGVVSDPVGVGLVESIRSSGNNLTGVTPASNVTASKRVEFIKEMMPDVQRVIFAWNDEKTSGIGNVRTVTKNAGMELIEQKVANVAEMKSFIQEFSYRAGDVILRASDGVAAGALPGIIETSIARKVPLIGTNSVDTERGALMSYGADYGEVGKAVARLADIVLKGALPSEIPVEEASQFDISINMETAQVLGITIPQSFLLKTSILFPEN